MTIDGPHHDPPADGLAIGYLTTHYPAVSHTFVQNEVAELRRQGARVETFAINPTANEHLVTDLDREEAARTVVLKSVPVLRIVGILSWTLARHPMATLGLFTFACRGVGLDLGRLSRRVAQAAEGVILARFARRAGLRHLHAHFGQAPANIVWFAAHLAGRINPTRPLTWSMTIHGPQDCLAEPPRLLRCKVADASFVVAVADFTGAQLLRLIPFAWRTKVHVVRCGVTVEDRVRPAGAERSGTVLMVARISPEKGHGVALEALARARASGADLHLRLIGPGDFESQFGPLIDELGLRDHVEVVGALPPTRVLDEMRAAEMLCLSSFAEGLPVVLMEAMGCRLPVIATSISGVPELVHDEETGLLVTVARADLLAGAILRMHGDPALQRRLGETARRLVEAEYDQTANVRQLVKLFTGAVLSSGEERSA